MNIYTNVGMLVKLLNGDLIIIDSIDTFDTFDSTDNIRRQVADHLQTSPTKVQLCPAVNEHYDFDALVTIAHHFVLTSFQNARNGKWLSTCTNTSAIRLICERSPFPAFFANPHPAAVENTIKFFELNNNVANSKLEMTLRNPADRIVDFILTRDITTRELQSLCCNPNPRIQAYLRTRMPELRFMECDRLFTLGEKADPELIAHALQYALGTGRFNTFPRCNHPIVVDHLLRTIESVRSNSGNGDLIRQTSTLGMVWTGCTHPEVIAFVLEMMDSVLKVNTRNGLENIGHTSNLMQSIIGEVKSEGIDVQPSDLVANWYLDDLPRRVHFRMQPRTRDRLCTNSNEKLVHHYIAHPEECNFVYRVQNTHPDAIQQCKTHISGMSSDDRFDFFHNPEVYPCETLMIWAVNEYGVDAFDPALIVQQLSHASDEDVVMC